MARIQAAEAAESEMRKEKELSAPVFRREGEVEDDEGPPHGINAHSN